MISIKKYIEVEKELSEKYGPFNLFALFLRENSPNKWDILVASDWVENDKQKSMRLIVKKLIEKLDTKELIDISKVAIIEESNPALASFQSAISIEHGVVEVRDRSFNGLPIKHAYVITSKRTDQREYASSSKS